MYGVTLRVVWALLRVSSCLDGEVTSTRLWPEIFLARYLRANRTYVPRLAKANHVRFKGAQKRPRLHRHGDALQYIVDVTNNVLLTLLAMLISDAVNHVM